MPYMDLEETALFEGGDRVEAALRVVRGALRYRLRFGRPGAWRVQFDNQKGDRMTAGGRVAAYAFRSVEQLRYDFERAIEDA